MRNLVILSIIAFVVWLLVAHCGYILICENDAAKVGQFGDWFGALNCLFSSLTMAGAIYAVFLQQKQYQDIKKEQDEAKIERERARNMDAISLLLPLVEDRIDHYTKKIAQAEAIHSKLGDLRGVLEIKLQDYSFVDPIIAQLPSIGIPANFENPPKKPQDVDTIMYNTSARIDHFRKKKSSFQQRRNQFIRKLNAYLTEDISSAKTPHPQESEQSEALFE